MSRHRVFKSPHALMILPATTTGRVLFCIALLSFVMSILPVLGVYANTAEMWGVLPRTIGWAYLWYAVNMLLAITVYYLKFLPWADSTEASGAFTGEGPSR